MFTLGYYELLSGTILFNLYSFINGKFGMHNFKLLKITGRVGIIRKIA